MANFKDLDALLQKYVDDGLPGCGMVIAKKGEVLYEKYFGYADIENKVPLEQKHLSPFQRGLRHKAITFVLK